MSPLTAQTASALDPVINLVSSEDEQDHPAPPPSKKPRHSADVLKTSSSRSRATSTSSQATIPQPLSPTNLVLQYSVHEYSASDAAALEDPAVKDAAFQLEPAMFLGMTDEQIKALSAGDYLWWMSDLGELELARCSHVSNSFSSDDSTRSVLINIVWHPCGKFHPQHSFQSSQSRLQRHFFQGQAVAWHHDGIPQQGEVNGHQLSPSGVEFMVDAQGSVDWCPWVPSCDLRAICSPGQSSSWSYSSMLDESTAISTGVFNPHEYLSLSPNLPSLPVKTVSCSLPGSPRPNSPDSDRTAEANPLASIAARLCCPTPPAAGRPSAQATPSSPSATASSPRVVGPAGAVPHPQLTSAAAAAAEASVADDSPDRRPLNQQQSLGPASLNTFHSSDNPAATSVNHTHRLDTQSQPLRCDISNPTGVAPQHHVPAAASAHAQADPAQAPECESRQLPSRATVQPFAGDSVSDADQDRVEEKCASQPESGATTMKSQLQDLTEERDRKGKGPLATSAAAGGFLVEEDSDDADLLMDLSWANVKSRGT